VPSLTTWWNRYPNLKRRRARSSTTGRQVGNLCPAAFTLLAASFLAGCIAHVHTPYAPSDIVLPAPDNKTQPFAYSPQPVAVEERPEGEVDEYTVHHVQFASYGENGQDGNLVSGYYYRSKEPGRKPIVIILPLWGTHTYPPEKLAKGIRKRSGGGMHVLMLSGEKVLIDWPRLQSSPNKADFEKTVAHMAVRFSNTAIDVRRTVDWLETRAEVESGRIGLVGFSIGAVMGGMLIPQEPRINSTALIMGGANPGVIFGHCNGKLEDVREAILPRFSWSVEQYQETYSRYFDKADPVYFAGRADPSRILMVDAHRDDCMPQSTRDNLWEALGRPERISFKYSHKRSFLSMTPLGFNFTGRKIYEFLDRSLAL